MATHSVNMLIKARDEASRKFGVVAVSAKVMGASLRAVSLGMKTAFTGAFHAIVSAGRIAFRTLSKIIKVIGVGLVAAFSYATYAAIKQQSADIELAAALKTAGQYSDALFEKLKQQASAIQENTTYGDEYVMTLMRQALTLGITADKAGEAAKAAIALYEGFGGGRGKPEIFLRYYVQALDGTSKSLDSYVGELRNAKTEQERQVVLQEAIARGWSVAESRTKSAGGALKLMRNVLGDVAEKIGAPFLSAITQAAKAITKWAVDNKAEIALWSEKMYESVVFVKDVFKSYIDFMRKDWSEGFKKSLEVVTMAFVAFGKSIISVMEKMWQDFENRSMVAGQRAIAKSIEYNREYKKALEIIKEETGGGIFTTAEAREEAGRRAREAVAAAEKAGVFETAYPTIMTKTWKETGQEIVKIWEDTLFDMIEVMPEFSKDVQIAFAKLQERLKALSRPGEAGAGPATFAQAMDEVIQKVTSSIGKTPGLTARETGFLTRWPTTGASADYDKQIAANTKTQINETKKVAASLKKIEGKISQTQNSGLQLSPIPSMAVHL